MPKETDRLKLPLPLGNESVTRESINRIFEKIDAGVATREDLDTLREAVSQMDIPDASLTQKGKVQLSNKADGTSETVAATEKAVRDAQLNAINVATLDATANIKTYIDTKTWQKHRLTADNGKSQLISGTNLNSLVANGQYNGNSLINAPSPGNANEWWYIDVQCHSNGSGFVIQRASRLNGGTQTLYHRTQENNIWQVWSPDVFQSGVDAKNGIVGAINAMDGSASTSDTWAQLKDKILGISTISPGNFSIYSAPTGSTSNGSLTLFRGIKISKSGTFRLNYTLVSTGGALATVRYMIDGVRYATDSTTTGQMTVGFGNIRLNAGQELQIFYFSANAGSQASIQNFTLGIDLAVTTRVI